MPSWRILTWCTRKRVTLKTIHSQLNVMADKLSKLGQTIQTEWSLHQKVFKQCAPDGTNLWTSGPVCYQVQQATSCLTGSRPPGLGSGRPQSTVGGIWNHMPFCGNHLGQVVEKLQDCTYNSHTDCTRVAQHALVLGPGEHV